MITIDNTTGLEISHNRIKESFNFCHNIGPHDRLVNQVTRNKYGVGPILLGYLNYILGNYPCLIETIPVTRVTVRIVIDVKV